MIFHGGAVLHDLEMGGVEISVQYRQAIIEHRATDIAGGQCLLGRIDGIGGGVGQSGDTDAPALLRRVGGERRARHADETAAKDGGGTAITRQGLHITNPVRDFRQTARNVVMRFPSGNCLIGGIRIRFAMVHSADIAGPAQGFAQHLPVGSPWPEHPVEPITGPVDAECRTLRDPIRHELRRHLGHSEPGQRAIAVEADEFRPEYGCGRGRCCLSFVCRPVHEG
jgi:hypothetical protein